MGTNYYAWKIPSKDQLDEVVSMASSLLNTPDNYSGFNSLGELARELNREIHICKMSSGWKVLFNHNNGEYYDLSRESLTNFLKNDHIIFDEYGQEFTVEKFWDKVDNHNSHNFMTNEEYFNKSQNAIEFLNFYNLPEIEEKFNVKAPYGDFIKNGLRWSCSTDFS